MSQIMKAFTGVFMVLFMMVSATGILGGLFQTVHAQNLHAVMTEEVENSNFSKSVLRDCFSTAEKCGYGLQLTLYRENGTMKTCEKKSDLPASTTNVSCVKIELTYPFQIAFFQIELEQKVFGYAK